MELTEIRDHLDRIDNAIVLLLAERLSLIPDVAEYKVKNNVPREQPEREKLIFKKKSEFGKKHGLRPEYVQDVFKRIIEESHVVEKEIIGEWVEIVWKNS